MSTWEKLPGIGAKHKGCLNCGPIAADLNLKTRLSVGFGMVALTRDGETVWSGDDARRSAQWAERQAAANPDHDWRLRFDTPLWDGVYQRHDRKTWVLVEKGQGFA